ncbi:MAG: O-antigen ligase family protein [Candidatus Aminicenantales bacterium]
MINKIVFWGICLVIVLLPLPFGAVDEWAVFVFEAATFVLFILYVVWEVWSKKNKEQPGAAGRPPFPFWLKMLAVFALGLGVLQLVPLPPSILGAISPRASGIWSGVASRWATLSLIPNFTLYELVRYVFYFLFALLVYKHVKTRKRVQVFVILLIGAACFQSIYGLTEFLSGSNKIFGFQKVLHLDSPTGTFVNRNHFTGFLGMVFPVSLGFLLAKASFFSGNRRGSFKERILWFSQEKLQKAVTFGIVPVSIGVGMFFSLTGIFIFFVSVFLMAAALLGTGGRKPAGAEVSRGTGRRRMAMRSVKIVRTVLLAVALAAILIGIRPVIERFSFGELAREVRPVYFNNTLEIIGDFPMAGTGLGTYRYAYPMYKKTYSGEALEHAHNDYLELLAEGGIMGGGLMIVIAFGALVWIFSKWARRRDHLVRGVGIGCLIGIVSILIHSLTDFNLHITANAVYFVTLYALAARLVGLNSSRVLR